MEIDQDSLRERMIEAAPVRSMRSSTQRMTYAGKRRTYTTKAWAVMAAAHPDAFTLIDRSSETLQRRSPVPRSRPFGATKYAYRLSATVEPVPDRAA